MFYKGDCTITISCIYTHSWFSCYKSVVLDRILLYPLSSWPLSDFTLLSHSVTCTFLGSPFFTSEMFLEWDLIN